MPSEPELTVDRGAHFGESHGCLVKCPPRRKRRVLGEEREECPILTHQHASRSRGGICLDLDVPCAFRLAVSHSILSQEMVYADIDRNPDCDPVTSREFDAPGWPSLSIPLGSSKLAFLYVLRRQACPNATMYESGCGTNFPYRADHSNVSSLV